MPQASFQADHYALAWSFLHYLLERPGDDNVKQFARFLRETSGSGSRPRGEVFERATGEDLEGAGPGLARTRPVDRAARGRARLGSGRRDRRGPRRARRRRGGPPLELVLIRCTPSFEDPFSSRALVHTTIPVGSEVELRAAGGFVREDSLRD